VSVVFCQLEFSSTGRSLVKGSLNDRACVCVCHERENFQQ